MRGTRRKHAALDESLGLIPTYAGNTGEVVLVAEVAGAHPHVCGEHDLIWGWSGINQGSSPRMRGTHAIHGGLRVGGGLIPTYAGNTLTASATSSAGWAHPHVCGEHTC